MASGAYDVDSSQVLNRVYDKESKTLNTGSVDDIKNIDEASATITYIGYARPGTTDIQARWRILRIEVIGTVTKIRWAEGNSDYSNVWTARADLSYS